MPDSISYPITAQTLPSGFCPDTWQKMLNEFSANQFVSLPIANSQLIVSATKPAVDFEGLAAWLKLDASGYGREVYWFANGAWFSKHPLAPGSIMIWLGDPTTIATFDGGETGTPNLTSGPMWAIVSQLSGRFPLGAGTLLPSNTVKAVGDSGGEDVHSQTLAELVPHTHVIKTVEPILSKWAGNQSGAGKIVTGDVGIAEGEASILANNPFFEALNAGGTGTPPVVTPAPNMPPYYTVSFIVRSAREYYRVD